VGIRHLVPERSADGVILHQPLSLTLFRFLGHFRPKNERDSCIPPPQKRRTPLPGAPAVTKFGLFFGLFSASFWPGVTGIKPPNPNFNRTSTINHKSTFPYFYIFIFLMLLYPTSNLECLTPNTTHTTSTPNHEHSNLSDLVFVGM